MNVLCTAGSSGSTAAFTRANACEGRSVQGRDRDFRRFTNDDDSSLQRWGLVAVLLTAFSWPAVTNAAEIRDDANFFSADAKSTAVDQLSQVEKAHNVRIVLVTKAALSELDRLELSPLDAAGKEKFYAKRVHQAVPTDHERVIAAVIWRKPAHLHVEFVKQLQEVLKDTGTELTAKAADDVFDAVFTVLVHAIRDKKRFSVPNFGTFNVRERKARKGVNPRTKAKIDIKASKVIRFKPTARFKASLG